ncbi:hypothetical protein AA101099_0816 [Neoasaia chiangmaiensis NBRC 101099]|uniref:Uncharacterized protein n=1 Tax=Neoasaia chiangmaiensis TaxID=320497 RepID=A0A1U9KME1_9PROT|nr:hypothetical protein [Neoasaia chiangmaiensis]AQS86945.1 hypothetical protein A0U93_02155 [Neoasaia chiangmaiensis]GBR37651.1 hypothetical protein AA101099_0816 [Neoasaia chiangmaiensis NBRC 101099]GEN15052.1 hypothetical protein NCH01_14830 [Neoasaia chiangmaiensis]
MFRTRILLGVASVTALSACVSANDADLMQDRLPDTLLTSYLIATGMAENHLVMRIARHQADARDISRLLAVDHNAWNTVRQAIVTPDKDHFRQADDSLRLLLGYATPVPPVRSKTD